MMKPAGQSKGSSRELEDGMVYMVEATAKVPPPKSTRPDPPTKLIWFLHKERLEKMHLAAAFSGPYLFNWKGKKIRQ